MGISTGNSSWLEILTSVITKSDAAKNESGLSTGIYLVLDAAINVMELVSKFQTNKEDLQVTGLFVAELTQTIVDGRESAGWEDSDVEFLATTLRNFEEYLQDLESSSKNIFQQAIDGAVQIATAEHIAADLERHNQHVLTAATALQLKLQIKRDIVIDETNDAVKKSIRMMSGFKDELKQTNTQMSNYTSKLDAILEAAIQGMRTMEIYRQEVMLRNRAPEPEVVQSLQELQRIIDERAQKERNAAAPIDLTKIVKRWMIASPMVEVDHNKVTSRTLTATVYQGRYNNQIVAIKCFHGVLNTDSYDLERDIVREVTQWEKVSKFPFVLKLIGVCTKVSKPLIVSEWCPFTVESYLDARPNRLLTIIYELICGLVSIHEVGVLHGDLKPSNILLTDQHHVKIADFSLSRSAVTTMSRQTRKDPEGIVINWTSPEMRFQARRAGPPADMWSFAMSVYQFLSKKIPYEGRSTFDIENALRGDNERPSQPTNLNRALIPLWIQLQKCWLKDPKERPTALEFKKFMENEYIANTEAITPGNLVIHARSANGLPKTQIFGTQDPFVEVQFDGKTYKTLTNDNGHTTPKWDSLLSVTAPTTLDLTAQVQVRIMNENFKLLGHKEIASAMNLTIGDLLEARRQNTNSSHPNYRRGFPLHPKGRIVIDAFVLGEETEPRTPSPIIMKRISAVKDAQEFGVPSTCIRSAVGIIGPLAVGKSTLINTIFGRQECPMSLWGGCTQEIQCVGEAFSLTLIDTPSYPFAGDIAPLRTALQSCRVVVVVFEKQVAEVLEVAEMAKSYGCSLVFVRNKRELLPFVGEATKSDLTSLATSILNKDNYDIQSLLKLPDCPNFYIDARAILQARLTEGVKVKLELLESWIRMVEAIRRAVGNPVSRTEHTDLRASIMYE
ncbi:unnamed protein product [Aphanomyces euteiches]|uniref:Uncharacterized protein n=1 Tax=Aphanomyces euteiches TaxID=100861 RepID=A0A6G0WZL6_9STRA|nr:hypothetical protein Ae201684_009877 [Aphanomyces euteiches]KAH9095868.1 hypothetical protein Ae201684P_010078 [Aphanomyces euteiches]KAH9143922.1 hypothetical protein AeRB84_012106 [Aphanomyces euteiches]